MDTLAAQFEKMLQKEKEAARLFAAQRIIETLFSAFCQLDN
jgi:hypothetical protein